MRSKLLLFFLCIILFSYIRGLYETNEFIRGENDILFYENLQYESRIKKLNKEIIKLKTKKVEVPVKKKKVIPKKEIVIEIEEVLTDSVTQPIDTTKTN